MRTKRELSESETISSKKQKQKSARTEDQENEDPQKKYSSLQTKYETLKNLRETEAEKLYNSLKKSVEEREEGYFVANHKFTFTASNKLISQLKEEKSKLQKALASSKKETSKEPKDLYNLQLKG
jgi:hypothetical protein